MQVANALNNNIRILFNPKVEAFKLFDFLIVKSDDDRYLAQIIEIYDDKFDASQNVAKLKLFYKISPNNEVMSYDNFTPSKECEIVKLNQQEIENFINQDKKVFKIGVNAKDSTPLNIQYSFFDNNPVILADKIETSNSISLSTAKNLSSEKHTVIIDTTGTIEYDGAKKIKASKNFKIPLNYSTIDYIFDRCLSDSTLEFQAVGVEILNEIKKFAKKQPLGFIPFTAFINVLFEQYKATPYPELKLLIGCLKKYQMDEIFARSKKDIENPAKTVEKNELTIIDVSNISSIWQKAFLEHIINSIETDCYVITRLNEENFDVDLINNVYNSKKNINFIPSVSYSYKKLPSLMQYCRNYILMPSIHQRMDFLDANFALCNLISDGCIIFGENTDGFLYIVKDYEIEIEEKRAAYRKISLTQPNVQLNSFAQDFMQFAPHGQSEQNLPEQKAIEELSALREQQEENFVPQQNETVEPIEVSQFDFQQKAEEEIVREAAAIGNEIQTEIEAEQSQQIEAAEEQTPVEEVHNIAPQPIQIENPQVNTASVADEISNIQEVANPDKVENASSLDTQKSIADIPLDMKKVELIELGVEDIVPSAVKMKEKEQEQPIEPLNVEPNNVIAPEKQEVQEDTSFKEIIKEEIKEDKAALQSASFQENNQVINQVSQNVDTPAFQTEADQNSVEPKGEDINFSDEELDFFEMIKEDSSTEAQNDSEEKSQEHKNVASEIRKIAAQEAQEDIDLSAIASSSVENNFEEIINQNNQVKKDGIMVDADTRIDFNQKPDVNNENLPIFNEKTSEVAESSGASDAQTSNSAPKPQNFKVNDTIVHTKYGLGKIVKIIGYEDRQLLQIHFDNSGPKLLDPKVANIEIVEAQD